MAHTTSNRPRNGPIRVLVVDDSALVRGLVSGLIDRQGDMVCIGTACHALQAREMIRELDPDVVTLDMAMPFMDGLDFLERLMRLRPTPVVVIATPTDRCAATTARALELGASAVIDKPSEGLLGELDRLEHDIALAIRSAARGGVRPASMARQATPASSSPQSSPARAVSQRPLTDGPISLQGRLIAIGASTGGTEATPRVLEHLPPRCPPVLIVQHMPGGFSARYAARLDAHCGVHVLEAEDGQVLQPGHAYIAPGGRHAVVERLAGGGLQVRLNDTEPVHRHRPSVDVLFRSVARVVGERAIGIMLTGMGGDGAEAMRVMRDAGAHNIAQDEASSAIFGMPREAIRAGACQEVLALDQIGPRVCSLLGLAPAAPAGPAGTGLSPETASADR